MTIIITKYSISKVHPVVDSMEEFIIQTITQVGKHTKIGLKVVHPEDE